MNKIMLRNEIDDIKSLSTSNHELEQKMGYNIPIYKYSELINFNTIDELLGKNKECIILYETTSPDNGHWVCCFKRGKTVSFFDSLGLMPDDQFHKISVKFRIDNGITKPYLTYLLSNYNGKVEYNEYELQTPDIHIATCGRWCVQRLKLKHLTPKQFYELYKPLNNYDSDDIVILTY
jgi:hypothetical protein